VRLGILSDTHGLLRPEVLEALVGVDLVLHAGDIGSPDILTTLEALAPVVAVVGNTDGFELRHRVPAEARLELEGLRFVVVHGDALGRSPDPEGLSALYPDAHVVVFGHTHRPLLEERKGCWFVNPGSCGPRRFDLPVGLVLATLDSGHFQAEWQGLPNV
jgi:uncharacterized protein